MTYGKGMRKAVNEGHAAEKIFMDLMRERGNHTFAANRKENMYEHIDCWVRCKQGSYVPFDIKGMKRSYKKDGNIILEYKNVRGDKGWLLGKAHFIAFQIEEGFLYVKRQELHDLGKKLCDLTDTVDSINKALYKAYTREKFGRSDLVTMIKMQDIKDNLEYTILEFE